MASVFQKFGGIRPMAAKVGLPSSTVFSWHRKRKIPAWRHRSILDAAKKHGVPISADELVSVVADEPETSGEAA